MSLDADEIVGGEEDGGNLIQWGQWQLDGQFQ